MSQSVSVNVLYSLANQEVTQVSFLNSLFLLITFGKLKRDNFKRMYLTHFNSKGHNILTVVAFSPGRSLQSLSWLTSSLISDR